MLENISNLSNLKGMEYFVLLRIGTVTYDGLRGTTYWRSLFGSRGTTVMWLIEALLYFS